MSEKLKFWTPKPGEDVTIRFLDPQPIEWAPRHLFENKPQAEPGCFICDNRYHFFRARILEAARKIKT